MDGWLSAEVQTGSNPEDALVRKLQYDASGCLKEVRSTSGPTHATSITSFVCGTGGKEVLRKTVDNATGKMERVISFAGLAEIRPDDGPGILLVRMTAAGSTVIEDARVLATGERDLERSGYLYKDLLGSVRAKTGVVPSDTPQIMAATDYNPWGASLPIYDKATPTHAFVDHEPDPGTGFYHFGARVYDPTLRWWLSPDPLLMALPEMDEATGAELNLYAYGRNNPVNFKDTSGMLTGVDDAVIITGAFLILSTAAAISGQSVGKALADARPRIQEATGKATEVAGRVAEVAIRAIGPSLDGSQSGPAHMGGNDDVRTGEAIAQLVRSRGGDSNSVAQVAPAAKDDVYQASSQQQPQSKPTPPAAPPNQASPTTPTPKPEEPNGQKASKGQAPSGGKPSLQDRIRDRVAQIRTGSNDGCRAPKPFQNRPQPGHQMLPRTDSNGKSISYTEYDLNPAVGADKAGFGMQRIVIGSDGRAYYTGNHYRSFTEVK